MPDYRYEGVDKSGKKVVGSVTASNEGEMRMNLRSQGVRPTRILKLAGEPTDPGMGKSGVPTGSSTIGAKVTDLVVFTRQLQVLISSGVPLVQSLGILGDQTADKNLKKVAYALRDRVSTGAFFWESLSLFPRVFPKLYIALIRAGESSGAIDQMLKRLTRYLEDVDRVRKMIKGAMFYPITVIVIGIGVVSALLIFVIPKFEELLTGSGQELPGPTKFVIDLSHGMVDNLGTIAAVLVIGGFGLYQFVQSEQGRAVVDRIVYNTPFFGELIQKGGIARFCRTLQTLLSSGVNLVDAIDICRTTIDNVVMESAVKGIRNEIETGKTLGAVVDKMPVFPKMAVQMISVGESTGNLDKMLEKVSDYYEAEVEAMVAGISKMIEPLILVFLGGAVGGLLIAMYLPIFKIAGGSGD
jgi:type IV pilus assembly protein PilC